MAAGAVSLHPLYADLPFEEQERALLPGQRRKVVLATSIAETSLTIEGVRTVVDSGLARRVEHHAASGMGRLVTVREARAQADQRAGRAGRTAPGVCYRLFSRQDYEALTAFAPPEMLVADLASLALELAIWGARDPAALPWLDPPPAARLAAARALLVDLGALDAAGAPTAVGRAMARLPLHPRLARLVLRAAAAGAAAFGCNLAALLSGRDVLARGGRRPEPVAGACDLADRIEALEHFRATGRADAGTDAAGLRAAARTAQQLESLLPAASRSQQVRPRPTICSGGCSSTPTPTGSRALRDAGGERYLLANGRGARLSPASCVRGNEFVVAVEVDAGTGGEGVIHVASAVDEATVREELAGRVVTERSVAWDARERRVIGVVRERIGAVVLAERPFAPGDDEALPVLCQAVSAERSALLPFGEEARQLQGRVLLLARAVPGRRVAGPRGRAALRFAGDVAGAFWPGSAAHGIWRGSTWPPPLRDLIPPRLRQRLDVLAPTHLPVPERAAGCARLCPARGSRAGGQAAGALRPRRRRPRSRAARRRCCCTCSRRRGGRCR